MYKIQCAKYSLATECSHLISNLHSIDLREIIEQQTLSREDTVRKEMQWEQEKARMSVKKLQDKYFRDSAVQYAKLRCFESGSFVTSFRTQKLQEGIDELLEHLEAKIEQEKMSYKDRETSMGLGISQHKDADNIGNGCHKGATLFSTAVRGILILIGSS